MKHFINTFLLLTCASVAYCKEFEERPLSHKEYSLKEFFPELNLAVSDIQLTGHIELPKTFSVIPYKKFSYIADGVVWGEFDSLKTIEDDKAQRNTKNIISPVFIARLSGEILQIGMDFVVTEEMEKEILLQLEQLNISDLVSKQHTGGNVPIYEITGRRADGRFFAVAWIGLNSSTKYTIFIDYRVPLGSTKHNEIELWRNFIDKSNITATSTINN